MTDHPEADKNAGKQRSWLERLTTLLAPEPKTREQLMQILRNAGEHDVVSSDMLGMIERILQVSEMHVRDIMIPKGQMVVVKLDSTLDKLLPTVIESGHSRFPVFDSSGEDVIGILLAKDLLKYCYEKDNGEFNIKDLLRPATFTPQSKRLDILLREFRANRNHLAIVLDEYGHVEGLVTIEDVLEQIVGEIEDEYDIDEDGDYIKKHANDTYIIKAQTPIDEFNEYFNTDFSDTEFDTIGGIVSQRFGHLPKRGENIKIQDCRFKVLHSDNRRIYLLEMKTKKKEL